MQDLRSYRKRREDLLFDALSLVSLIATQLPVRVTPGSLLSRSHGSQWNSDELRLVASKIEDVTYRFDQLQYTLGLWDHDARFGHPPAGSADDQPSEESPSVAAKKKSNAKPKTAPSSKKPAVLDRDDAKPSKSKPKSRGGSGYSSAGRHG